MNKLYIIVLSIIIILCSMLPIYLYVSLVPYFRIVGYIALALLIIIALCAIAFIFVFTLSKTSIMLSERKVAINNRQLLTHGEVVVWLRPDGSYVHLSALHEAAKVPALPSPDVAVDADTPDEIQLFRPQDIVEMYNAGQSERSIVDVYKSQGVKITRYQIQKILGKV